MDKAAKLKLKQFIEDHIPFYELKEVGFLPKGIRKTDYEAIAKRVCEFFELKDIYEYGKKMDRSDMNLPTNWPNLKIDKAAIISKDSWLN